MTSLKELWNRYCPSLEFEAVGSIDPQTPFAASWLTQAASPVDFCDRLGELYVARSSVHERKRKGQFFTPPAVARYMAAMAGDLPDGGRVLEPGAGVGILVAALAERIAQDASNKSFSVRAYETDSALKSLLLLALGYTRAYLAERNIELHFELCGSDFLTEVGSLVQPSLFAPPESSQFRADLVLSNPPYFKLSHSDPRFAILPEAVNGQPNIYALFVAVAARCLTDNGRLVFIIPRSFCSGQYFRQFRKTVFQRVHIERLHLFDSRKDAFSRDAVLQENVILVAARANGQVHDTVSVSHSKGLADLPNAASRSVAAAEVLDLSSPEAMIHIPVDDADDLIRRTLEGWQGRLHTYGLQVSTGPVVPFRSRSLLREGISYRGDKTAPLLWLQNVERFQVTWPLSQLNKPQHIVVNGESRRLLVRNANYVLLRRFSAKEANDRIVATPYLQGALPGAYIGLENHLNYVHRPGGLLTAEEAWGLAAYFNSRYVEQYFRTYSGNTQVSATELRSMPLPPLDSLVAIGRRMLESEGVRPVAVFNQILAEELDLEDHAVTTGRGGHMTKIEEAKDLLQALNLPPRQRNDIAALTLLALANLAQNTPWRQAARRSITIHNIIGFIEQHYGRKYAENTRETIRRQVIHQFEQARLVDRNPDDPTLSTNSPRSHYALSREILPVLQHYGTGRGSKALAEFTAAQGTLLELYQQRKRQHLIPLKDSAGRVYHLSPGRHNRLQAAVIEQFAPRFAAEAQILYLGDAANKTLVIDQAGLTRIGFPVDKHDKLPDIMLYSQRKKWLYLIEAVTSHGPVSPKRMAELELLMAGSAVERIYVSAFPNLKQFKAHVGDIAWETEVWIEEMPDHLIHFNGDKFLGPRRAGRRTRTKHGGR